MAARARARAERAGNLRTTDSIAVEKDGRQKTQSVLLASGWLRCAFDRALIDGPGPFQVVSSHHARLIFGPHVDVLGASETLRESQVELQGQIVSRT
jgi:hypothetical protein